MPSRKSKSGLELTNNRNDKGEITMEFVTLKNGVKMLMEGFGVFQVPEAEVCDHSEVGL